MTGELLVSAGEDGRADAAARARVVVMGVSASGKSSVGAELARLIGARFVDADDLHPAANVAKMAAGIPLEDEDRWPWLDAVAATITDAERTVVACSALKRSYRDRLRDAAPGVVFVHLTGSPELLAARAGGREGHFMPPALLSSQLDTLQPLGDDEVGVALDVTAPVADLARAARGWLDARAR
ncbi:gluconokinase [Microbacterium ureisolvens]|uniref:Gluconokinase n=1 Tax=Microbacterium ureisolvens TaxID=2781186 RepID=A0ABS7I161_9MICO|nr:gluconokinase [Microbacterium ureisolvens]MBW9110354.1 gluconokinase [Microbacterium ureisolvens]